MGVAILSDTNSGISRDEAEALGVFVLPMPIIIDDTVYYEGDDISESEFYDALVSGKKVSTSQPTPGDVMDMWNKLLDEGFDEVVYIPMSSGLSSSCHSAIGYSDDWGGRVVVVDNHRISVTLRQSVMRARQLADAGRSAADIKEILEREAYDSSIYISLNTLEYLKRGGRVTPAASVIATVLGIKPVLTIQGEKLDAFTKVRGKMSKCECQMIEAIKKDIKERFDGVSQKNMYIGAAGAALEETDRARWLDMVKNEFPEANVYYDPLSASIGSHTGPGAVGIGLSIVK